MVLCAGHGKTCPFDIFADDLRVQKLIMTKPLSNIEFAAIHMVGGQEGVCGACWWCYGVVVRVDGIATGAIGETNAADIANIMIQQGDNKVDPFP